MKVAIVSELTTIDEIEAPLVPGIENKVDAVSCVQSDPVLPWAVTVIGAGRVPSLASAQVSWY